MKLPAPIRVRQTLGKYRIRRRIGKGGFAEVFEAYDTLEGAKVALKVPTVSALDHKGLEEFRREAQIIGRLDHAGILPMRSATVIDDRMVLAYPLGECSLAERLERRLAARTALDYAEQLLEAIAHAHENNVVHCDVKPENVILFPGGRIRLCDFGIAKIAWRTLKAEGTGTVGYIAPEQAYGKVSYRSDVFSTGLLLYRMLTGVLPQWPFEWPMEGSPKLRANYSEEFAAWLKRCLQIDARKRFADGGAALRAFQRLKQRGLLAKTKGPAAIQKTNGQEAKDWREVRFRQFKRRFGRTLDTRLACPGCRGPISESMLSCPWCRRALAKLRGETKLPAQCPRCRRGVKLDWKYCACCYGAQVGPLAEREYRDKNYVTACKNSACERRELLPFSRYCPHCRAKTERRWTFPGADRCKRCQWGVAAEFWEHCPWCAAKVKTKGTTR